MSSDQSQGLVSVASEVKRDGDDLDDLIEELERADPSFRGALDDADARRSLLQSLIGLRQAGGLTQAALAAGMATTQSAVSELEGGATDPRLSTLQRYARAAGSKITVTVEPTVRVFSEPGGRWTKQVTITGEGSWTPRILWGAAQVLLPPGLAHRPVPVAVTGSVSTSGSVGGNEPSVAA